MPAIFLGCFGNVARDNPFDPLSDDFTASGSVSGIVSNRALDPLPDAEVQLTSQTESGAFSLQSITDAEGRFRFEMLPEGRYLIQVERAEYVIARDSISINTSESGEVNFTLNALPAFRQVSVQTAHISRVWPPPTDFTLLEVTAEVTDGDGLQDVDRVWIDVSAIGVVDTLQIAEMPGVHTGELTEDDLGLSSMHDLVGKTIDFSVRDRLGAQSVLESFVITRIVSQTPVVTAPQAGAVLPDPQPTLLWVCQPVPFSFSFRVEIVRVDDVVRNTVSTWEDLVPADVCDERQEGRIQVTTPLDIGSYFWTVSIVDEFGNRSRSREAGFVVVG